MGVEMHRTMDLRGRRARCPSVAAMVAATIGLGAAPCGAQMAFIEVSDGVGILSYRMPPGMGSGVAAADYDDDGDIDLFVPTGEGFPNQLYRNRGDGTFEEVAAQVGLDNTERARVALWFDYDGDGRLDLVVHGDCWGVCHMQRRLWLYRQQPDGTFVETTQQAGLGGIRSGQEYHAGGMAAADINNDGYVDLAIGLWIVDAILLLNNGDGTFTDISVSSGITAPTGPAGPGEGHWQPMFHDFNGDGWIDLLWAIDFTANHLWINRGDLTFVDVAPAAGIASAFNEMGLTLGDIDNDGDFDAYMTNITTVDGRHSVLFRNDSTPGSLRFTEISRDLDVDDAGWGWGTVFADFDNDGRVDLIATNGWGNPPYDQDRSRFWRNVSTEAGLAFVDVSDQVGFNDTLWGSGLLAADLDRDGDLDIVQTASDPATGTSTLRVLRNDLWNPSLRNAYLTVQPRMDGPNRYAIGAVVRATAGGRTCSRLISAGTSFLSQEPAEAFFGLSVAERIDQVRVEWPDGRITIVNNVAPNQVLVVRPCALDLDGDGLLGVGDFFAFTLAFAAGEPQADINGDGRIDIADFFAFTAGFAAGC